MELENLDIVIESKKTYSINWILLRRVLRRYYNLSSESFMLVLENIIEKIQDWNEKRKLKVSKPIKIFDIKHFLIEATLRKAEKKDSIFRKIWKEYCNVWNYWVNGVKYEW